MMKITSDERRKIAAKLRALADGKFPMDECSVDDLYTALGMPFPRAGIEYAIIGYLADLIDPATSTTTFTPEESPIPLPVRLWKCAMCGEEVIMMNDEGEPAACPYCKAVVADDD